MKNLPAFVFLLIGTLGAFADNQDFKVAKSELLPLEGRYTFNPSDSDEMAVVQVTFRRPTKSELGEKDEWRADGKMHNSFHGTVINFKGALVWKDGDDIVVDGQFFSFRLKNGVLKWDSGYERELYLKGKKPAEQAGAGQPATRPESKLKGSDKPQPEAEGRSR